ncbi:D-sedoheptulose-7-phosphate isomerase [Sphaerimonospora sp. CA-214678]|uniref:D-sedoheptulose-7-phosphate isomerase n=1 Tax=Sphaerimonospora sp. CA-214678 TaxID=3240029 RepID=UPI003D8E04E5
MPVAPMTNTMNDALHRAFARRVAPGDALIHEAEHITRACRDMAERFRRGGKLIVFGGGGDGADAAHVAVEFMHPVIVGRRALPALALSNDAATVTTIGARDGLAEAFTHQIASWAGPGDIALGISRDGRCAGVLRGLAAARRLGLLTVALLGGQSDGDGGETDRSGIAADHCLLARSHDPDVVKELHVTTYHLLWELVHVLLDTVSEESRCGLGEPPSAEMRGLYPFLYSDEDGRSSVSAEVVRSTEAKAAEIARLRTEAAGLDRRRIAACAQDMAVRFAAGGRLFTFGNGGSSTDAQEVTTTFLAPASPYRPLPAHCLTSDVALVTALSNDVGFDVVFSRQLAALGRPGDIALGLSTSGDSGNVVQAFEEAAGIGMLTVGLAGAGGGRLAESGLLDHLFVIPSSSVHRVQEAQTTLYHVLWELTQVALDISGRR